MAGLPLVARVHYLRDAQEPRSTSAPGSPPGYICSLGRGNIVEFPGATDYLVPKAFAGAMRLAWRFPRRGAVAGQAPMFVRKHSSDFGNFQDTPLKGASP